MATVTTKKDGFREITGLDSEKFSSSTDPTTGHTTWTATTADGVVGIKWGPGDEQSHGGDPPLKVGSTIEEWTGADGKHHAVITRVK
ncbi:MAG TPA: hypothetical protein VJP77_05890 [Planctomycetota bacterium]|nr:hypothetical protein [Planctomycetota bacterium]